MPSMKPTWASWGWGPARWGMATRSPSAHTPGSPVRQVLVDDHEARARRRCTAVPSRPSDPLDGLRPTDTTTTSTSSGSAPSNCTEVPESPGWWPVTLHPGAHVDPPLLERALDDAGHVVVAAREDLGEGLEDGDLGAQVAEVRGELAADRAPADDRRPSRAGRRARGTRRRSSRCVPSTSKPGMVRGTEPDARNTASPVSSTVVPSSPRTVTRRSAPRDPVPVEDRDLAPLQQPGETLRRADR